jgi:hypothetical protein
MAGSCRRSPPGCRVARRGDDLRFTASPAELAARAEAAHGEHEKCLGRRDEGWAGVDAEYMVQEKAGAELVGRLGVVSSP